MLMSKTSDEEDDDDDSDIPTLYQYGLLVNFIN